MNNDLIDLLLATILIPRAPEVSRRGVFASGAMHTMFVVVSSNRVENYHNMN